MHICFQAHVTSCPTPLSHLAHRDKTSSASPTATATTMSEPEAPSQPAVSEEERAEAELWWKDGGNRVEGPLDRVHPM